MSSDAGTLKRLSELLDEGMDLDVAVREAWLDGLPPDDAPLAPRLRRMLADDGTSPLDRGPAAGLERDASDSDSDTSFHAGDSVGPYHLIRVIGQGGMGEVWLADRDDGQLRRQVALKLPILGLRRSVLVQRFARERDILGALAHPNIARLYDAGVAADGQPWLALEYVEGNSITVDCESRELDTRARVELFRQVLRAVQFAHANLVVHRDLKPSNVLVTARGQAMLLDFGIAKLLQDEAGDAAETELTRIGGRAMTLDYAAPEQLSGAPVSTATDVWALGVLLYELVSGRKPFHRETRGALEEAVLNADPPAPHPPVRSRSSAADLDTIVLKALKKLPADRYPTADAFDLDLGRWLRGEPVLAQPDSGWYRTRMFIGRNRIGVALAAVVAAFVLGASGVALRQAQLARQQAERAEQQTVVARTEAATAEAVQSFLESVFRANSGDQADPVRARQATAEQLLDRGAERIRTELDATPAAKLRVLKTLGDMYEDMGRLDRSASMHESRVVIGTRDFGATSDAVLSATADLAMVRIAGGHLVEAGNALRPALAGADARGDVEPATRLGLDLAMGTFYRVQGDPRGIAFASRAVTVARSRPPEVRQVIAEITLGDLFVHAGRVDEAMLILREALDHAATLGPKAASVAAEVHAMIADAELERGDVTGAETSIRRAVALATQNSGAASQLVVIYRDRLADVFESGGRLAESVAERATDRQLVEGWPESPERAFVLAQMTMLEARALLNFGRPAQAAQQADRVAAMGALASLPSNVLVVAVIAARARSEMGLDVQAEQRLEEARRDMSEADLSSPNMVAIWQRAKLALALARLDATAARAALAEIKTDAAGTLAELALLDGEPEGAERSAREALAKGPRVDVTETASLEAVLGRALLAQGRAREAMPLIVDALSIRERVLDRETSPLVAQGIAARGEALRQLGDIAAARQQLARAEAIHRRHPSLAAYHLEPVRRLRAALSAEQSNSRVR